MKKYILLIGILIAVSNIFLGIFFWRPEGLSIEIKYMAIFLPLGVIILLTILKILVYGIMADKDNQPNSVLLLIGGMSMIFLATSISIKQAETSLLWMVVSSLATGIIISYIYVTWREGNWYIKK